MKITIEVDVDNFTGRTYEYLNPDSQKRIVDGLTQMLKETVSSERKTKLQALLDGLQRESDYSTLDPEILYDLFQDEEK